MARLEAATSRLEDIATYTEAPKETSALRKGAEASTGGDTFSAPPPNSLQPLLEVVEEFDIFIGSSVEKYIQLSNDLGGLIAQQVLSVPEASRPIFPFYSISLPFLSFSFRFGPMQFN